MSRTRALSSPILLTLLLLIAWGLPSTAGAASAARIASGWHHVCATTTAGTVKCWGYNYAGQLGDGTTTDRATPTDVSGLTSAVTSIVAGMYHTCVVVAGGAVKCWGFNTIGQLGDDTVTDRWTPVSVAGLSSGVASVVAGYEHTCALTTGGGVKCWGDGYDGQLGDGGTTARHTPVDVSGATSGIVALAAGGSHTCAATSGGAVKCWGWNNYGQLGDGSTTNRLTPTTVPGLTGVVAVAAGNGHTCALTSAGGVKCWGGNAYGQLGDGAWTARPAPADVVGLTSGVASIVAGSYHTCAVTTGGAAKCWGLNGEGGQLGDGTVVSRTTPVVVSALATSVTAMSAGNDHTCAATTGGGVKCWGSNEYGQLGHGDRTSMTTPQDVIGAASGTAAITTGWRFSCLLTSGGGVKCWGANDSGQVGDGTSTSRATPTNVSGLTTGVSQVDTGKWHACARTTAGGVKCWGLNNDGQLGDGTITGRQAPTDVSGLTSGVASIAAGHYHTCAVTSGGAVKCWGSNYYSQMGDGTTTSRWTPTAVMGLTSGVASISAGEGHTCALTTGGGVKCWGENSQGQLGDGSTINRSTPVSVAGLASGVAAVAAGGYHTCALTTAGGLKCWGFNVRGQLGNDSTTSSSTPVDAAGLASGVIAVGAGDYHTCAVTTGGALKCWGENSYGQLGVGTLSAQFTPTAVSGLGSGVAAVAGGNFHTCALTSAGGLKCWGWEQNGQLGDRPEMPPLVPVRALRFGRADFDADNLVDVAVYRPSTGTWFSMDSSADNTAYRYRGWGVNAQGDTPVVGDFDGDGVIDPTVFRPATGTWFTLLSASNYTRWNYVGWGQATDTLVPGDYDGDGKTDAAVYRSSTGTWYIKPSSGASQWNTVFGQGGDVPIAGDFDGDGKRDPAVYRPSTGTWFWLKSSTGFTTSDYRGWGVNASGDTPAPGDYDGDGKTDLCVFRPSTGSWFILESHTGLTAGSYFGWGTVGDTLVPADYDGDGRTDGAVYRPATGTWYVRPSSGAAAWNVVFGQAGDEVLVTIR